MTWETLRHLLDDLPGGDAIRLAHPADALRVCEERASADPRSRPWHVVVRALNSGLGAGDRIPVELCGVRRERLLMWSPWTASWVVCGLST